MFAWPQKIINRGFCFWLIVGLIIRLAVMPFTAHSDMWPQSLAGYLAANQHILNISQYMRDNPDPQIAGIYAPGFFPYPILALLFFMVRELVFKIFYQMDYFQFLLGWYGPFLEHPLVNFYIFIWKLPYLIFDLGTAYLLTKFFINQKQKILAFALWMLNPWTIYTTFMFGQCDIIPTFAIVLALLLAYKKQSLLAILTLGLAIAFKSYPLMILPAFCLILSANPLMFIGYFFLGLAPTIISDLPFYSSLPWRQDVLFSFQSQFLTSPAIPAGNGENVLLFPLIWALILGGTYLAKVKVNSLWAVCLAIFLGLFSISYYYPQWVIWMSPFIVILLVKNPRLITITGTLFILWLILISLFERSLTIGLFSPLWPALHNIPSFGEAINPIYPALSLKSIIRGLFAAPGLYLIYKLSRTMFSTNSNPPLDLEL
ncbi:MAG: hypothetical protein V1858_04195 [Candidatus Gottesmanbacteria bacterium]